MNILKNSSKEIDVFVDTDNTEYMIIEDNIIGFIKDVDVENNSNINTTKVTTANKDTGANFGYCYRLFIKKH